MKLRVWKRHIARKRRADRWWYVHARGCVLADCCAKSDPVYRQRRPSRYVVIAMDQREDTIDQRLP